MILLLSLSTAVLNSRDWPKNIWLPKRMHLHKQWYKNQNTKSLPQCYNYSSNNGISWFKQAKCWYICPLENFKNFEQDHVLSVSLPAPLSTRNWLEPILLCIKPSIFAISIAILYRISFLLCLYYLVTYSLFWLCNEIFTQIKQYQCTVPLN